MTAIDFPDSPTVGQLFTVGDVTWEWTGSVWQGLGTPTPGAEGPAGADGTPGPGILASATAPEDTTLVWYNTENGNAYTYYDDFWTSITGLPSIPVGGTTGQVLAKSSSTDYATQWVTPGILQVVQGVKTDTASRTSTAFDDIAGLSVSITPSSTSSKILVIAQVVVSANSDAGVLLRLRRDSTDIYLGDAASNRPRVSANSYSAADNRSNSESITFLDSPNTTSAVTYKIQFAGSAAAAIYVNRTVLDTDSAPFPRAASSITAMEVAG
jgi:hypothetical protein